MEALPRGAQRGRRDLSGLPETRSRKRRNPVQNPRALAGLAFAAVFVAVALIAAWSSASSGFSPGEEIYATGVADVAADAGDAPFPGTDVSRFGPGTGEVRVFLRVEDLAGPAAFVATVERSGRSSVLSRFFGSKDLAVSGGGEDQLSASDSGVSGVVAFSVRERGGEALPVGEYTVSVRFAGAEEGGPGAVVARKYFVVGDP